MDMSLRPVDRSKMASWSTVGCWLLAPSPFCSNYSLNECGMISAVPL